MEHPLGAGEQLEHAVAIDNTGLDKAKLGLAFMAGDIRPPPDREVVDRKHRATRVEQGIDEMAADKAGAAGHDVEFFHAVPYARRDADFRGSTDRTQGPRDAIAGPMRGSATPTSAGARPSRHPTAGRR